MNKEQNKKYLDIVKNGNYDDMFDFGCEITKQELLEKMLIIRNLKKEEKGKSLGYWEGYTKARTEDIKLVN